MSSATVSGALGYGAHPRLAQSLPRVRQGLGLLPSQTARLIFPGRLYQIFVLVLEVLHLRRSARNSSKCLRW